MKHDWPSFTDVHRGRSSSTSDRPFTDGNDNVKGEAETNDPNPAAAFHSKGPIDEKYLSTASDRAADHEVCMTSSV